MMIIETIGVILIVIGLIISTILGVGEHRYDNGSSKYSPHHPSKSSNNP